MHPQKVKALFGIEPQTHDEVYEGYHIPSIRWNGWACPSFDRANTERLAASLNRAAEQSGFDPDFYTARWEGDVLVLTLPQNMQDGDGPERYAPDEDGLYNVGSWGWVWDDLDFPAGIDLSTPEAMDAYLAEGRRVGDIHMETYNAVLTEARKLLPLKDAVALSQVAGRAAVEAYSKSK